MSDQAVTQPVHEYQRFLQQLPRDWGRKEIRQLGTVIGGGTPSRNVPSFWRGNIPWATPGEVSGNATKSKLLHDTNEHISPSGLAGSGANLLPAGALMVTTRATLGARAINAVPMATNQGFKSIVFKQTTDPDFYHHLFEKVQPELVRRASGTTFLEISGAEFGGIEVPSPNPGEKRLITEILDTLDAAIHETEAIIAKVKAVKQGLLHDLLARGIHANGELRPLRAEAPHLFKPSPLGWIPKEWDTPTLAQACSLIRDGTHLPPVRVANGPLLLSVRNMQDGQLVLTDQDTRVSEAFYRQMHKSWEVKKDDVLLAIVGATIGKTAIVGDMPKFTLQRSVAVLRGRPDRLLNAFLHLYMGSPEFQSSLWAKVNQTAQPGIYLDQLGTIAIRVPLPLEQEAIQQKLLAAQRRIDEESDVLLKLRWQKSGLMDDLLAGRVRVTPLLAEAEQQEVNA
jgi:type I restriction enzyme S subunit